VINNTIGDYTQLSGFCQTIIYLNNAFAVTFFFTA